MQPRPMRTLAGEGGRRPWIGANFWSREGGPRMWSRYDGDIVRQELRVLREHGLTMTRSFFYWPDFMPEPDRLDETACRWYADFLDAHHELGMGTIPTFIVGHMSGENWDPSWRQGRDIYSDVWMVGRQAWYITELTRRFHSHPAVIGWLISNEIPIYGGEGDERVINSWALLMVNAVRAGGGTQPVSLGDGQWGVETTGHDSGFCSLEYGPLVDFVGPHVYRMEHDRIRQHLKAAFICELAAVADRPVIMEEFGLSSDFASPQASATYYRQLLHATLAAGATGWIAWNNTDYDNIKDQRPYSHHPFELHFGITDHRGRPKPPLKELEIFSEELRDIDFGGIERARTDTAIIVPSYLAARYPFTEDAERVLIVDASEQAHVAAREADLAPGIVHEPDYGGGGGLPGGYELYLLPSAKQLTAPSWRRLGELVRAGATVYASYCAGETSAQRGPWWNDLEGLFGVRQLLTYGLNDPVDEDVVESHPREGLREPARRRGAVLRRRRERGGPRPPADRGGRPVADAGHRPRRAGPARAGRVPPRAGAGGAVHLSGRVLRGAPGAGQPGGHLAPVRRAGGRGRGHPPGARRRPPGHGRLAAHGRRRPVHHRALPARRARRGEHRLRRRGAQRSRAAGAAGRTPRPAAGDRSARRRGSAPDAVKSI